MRSPLTPSMWRARMPRGSGRSGSWLAVIVAPPRSIVRKVIDRMAALRHQHAALEADEHHAVLFAANGAHRDDALGRALRRLALRQHLGLRIDRVADEH